MPDAESPGESGLRFTVSRGSPKSLRQRTCAPPPVLTNRYHSHRGRLSRKPQIQLLGGTTIYETTKPQTNRHRMFRRLCDLPLRRVRAIPDERLKRKRDAEDDPVHAVWRGFAIRTNAARNTRSHEVCAVLCLDFGRRRDFLLHSFRSGQVRFRPCRLTRALQRTASPPCVRASREFVSAPCAPPPPPRPSLSLVVRHHTTRPGGGRR